MFIYEQAWLEHPDTFTFSPDLTLASGPQYQRASGDSSPFPLAVADTEPEAWGRRVIMRDHAKRRQKDPTIGPLTEMDILSAVDDESRIGAIRLREGDTFIRAAQPGRRRTPILVALKRLHQATVALERNTETQADLDYLLGKGTSLGGLRPKSSIHYDGVLAIGKFPSVSDQRSVTRAEVLALHLAARAGIQIANSRIVVVDDVPVAVIDRFDRRDGGRIPYLSAHSFVAGATEATYLDIAEQIRANGASTWRADLEELWRRLVFNLLITNVDDHLHNLGFLHERAGRWRLSPAFDLNPFPERARESKTMLSDRDGPISELSALVGRAADFGLTTHRAKQIIGDVHVVVADWRTTAQTQAVGMSRREQDDFQGAFAHDQMDAAARI
ncbi:MAG: HipA domain-containing protein [Dokdonella sp.]